MKKEPTERETLIAKAREATTVFRDFAREHGMSHWTRDPLVMVIHNALDLASGGASPQETEKGCEHCARFMHALGGSTVRLYPDANYEKYLDELTGTATDECGDTAEEGNEHRSALIRQMTEAIAALRRSRDELRRDMTRVARVAIIDEDASPDHAQEQTEPR